MLRAPQHHHQNALTGRFLLATPGPPGTGSDPSRTGARPPLAPPAANSPPQQITGGIGPPPRQAAEKVSDPLDAGLRRPTRTHASTTGTVRLRGRSPHPGGPEGRPPGKHGELTYGKADQRPVTIFPVSSSAPRRAGPRPCPHWSSRPAPARSPESAGP